MPSETSFLDRFSLRTHVALIAAGVLALLAYQLLTGWNGAVVLLYVVYAAALLLAVVVIRRYLPWARYGVTIVMTALIVLLLPEPFVTQQASLAILFPPFLTLVLLHRRWIVLIAVATLLGLLARAGSLESIYTKPDFLLIYSVLVGMLVTVRGTIDREMHREQMLRREYYDASRRDSLTGLANRRQLLEVGAVLEQQDAPICVLAIDLDRFKSVNDTLGHNTGDVVLTEIGRRFTKLCPPGALLARTGGDEFFVVLDNYTPARTLSLAQQLAEAAAAPLTVDASIVRIGCTIGIATRQGAQRFDDLLRYADIALYSAKGQRMPIGTFTQELREEVEHAFALEYDLRTAVENGQILTYYQPIVDLHTHTIVGVEALLRWQHPVRGWVSPAQFVPMADRIGLIDRIASDSLTRACHELRQWNELQLASPLFLSFNLIPRQVEDHQFIARVLATVEECGLNPSQLHIEITENAILNRVAAHENIEALRAKGVRIALDDFGTGYASLATLHHIAIDTLKIDRSFVQSVQGHQSSVIIEMITAVAGALPINLIAEGVETAEQIEFLLKHGCRYGQGYYFAPALSADEIFRRLTSSSLPLHLPRPALATACTYKPS
jgi:diguanylate cyclase (GGDEF)-like protein